MVTVKFILYKTTCNVNKKIYYGKHKTKNLDDGYLGSGIRLRRAIRKYGKENFTREILFIAESEEHLNEKERELITQEVLDDPNCYNLALGGQGGDLGKDVYLNRIITWSDEAKNAAKIRMKDKWENDEEFKLKMDNRVHSWITMTEEQKENQAKSMSDTMSKLWQDPEHKKKISELTRKRMLENPPSDSFKYATRGKKWVTNHKSAIRKLVSPEEHDELVASGWESGKRKFIL